MKKLIVLSLTLFLTIGLFAQGPFTGFFKPSSELELRGLALRAEGDVSHEWYFRPAAQMTALQFTYNKELKLFESSTFSSAGLGIGLQHYVEKNGVPVNNYGFNALIIIDGSQSSNGGVGMAATVNALQFVNIGAGYTFTGDNKHFYFLTGAIWTF